MPEGLSRYCPQCPNHSHREEAKFCDLCGSELNNTSLREFYLSLKIPQNKIALEQNRKGEFDGCPFFLRKEDCEKIEVITVHEYPKGKHLISLYPHTSHANFARIIELSPEVVEKYLEQGFAWLHESEIDTLW